MRTCLAVLTQYRRVTDRRTDRHTDILRQHSPRYAEHCVVIKEACAQLTHLTFIERSCTSFCETLTCACLVAAARSFHSVIFLQYPNFRHVAMLPLPCTLCSKFSFEFVTFSKSCARKQMWLFLLNTVYIAGVDREIVTLGCKIRNFEFEFKIIG